MKWRAFGAVVGFIKVWPALIGALMMSALMCLPAAAEGEAPSPLDASTIQRTAEQRIGGADRFGTAANLARWLPVGDGHRVVVATGEAFPDALSVGPLAAREQSRVLLTRGGSLPDPAVEELRRKVPQEILIVGGPGAVSDAVAAQLSSIAPVTRVGGTDRYETAALVAAGMTSDHVVVASGQVFADAVPAGPLAAKLGAPLLLTRQGELPSSTAQALRELAPSVVTVMGGPGAISEAVLQEIERVSGASATRIGGADRFETASLVARTYFPEADTALVASGIQFPDGLSGTPLAHAYGAPILLSTGNCASAFTTGALAAISPLHTIYLGGPSAVTSSPAPCGTSALRAGINPPRAAVPDEVPLGSPAEEAFYFVPHQDDELISMVGGIARDINDGRRVHVYLMFAGYWTRVKDALCTQLNRCLTNEQMTASRNAELLSSLERIGVPAGNVHFLYITEEASDSEATARGVITQVMTKAGPSARYRTMSWLDGHPSHFRLGHAVKDQCESDSIVDCLFFQSPLYQEQPEAIQSNPVVTPQGTVLTALPERVAAAAAAYKEDYPKLGRHSVGWRSVESQITWIENHAYSWAHGRVWASAADELAAAEWIDRYQSVYSASGSARTPTATIPFEEDID
ncbi:cell wall-binding repeat-containing protein [Tessaracoccus sp. MC1679]|uniref:cell wall-binding repeat-containing protein n=1 Tax=Tessaracoccus sp. MC1679 TaxID=2760313 RepID=UPI0016004BD2|nr:cell wall-binding repeat-containing protein [Tessaracoccus sp. MC1679]MBB1514782.1 cell wall-binding repeat-containing protein [Tessaracoccus sp. MC1679]